MEYLCFLISVRSLERLIQSSSIPETWFQWNFHGFQRVTAVEEMTPEAVLRWGKQFANAKEKGLHVTPMLVLNTDEEERGLPEGDWENIDYDHETFLEQLRVLYVSQHPGLSPEIVEAEKQFLNDMSKPDAGYLLSYQSHSRLVKAGYIPKMPLLWGCQEFNTVYADAAKRWRSKNQC